jgi:hypothetical protein
MKKNPRTPRPKGRRLSRSARATVLWFVLRPASLNGAA